MESIAWMRFKAIMPMIYYEVNIMPFADVCVCFMGLELHSLFVCFRVDELSFLSFFLTFSQRITIGFHLKAILFTGWAIEVQFLINSDAFNEFCEKRTQQEHNRSRTDHHFQILLIFKTVRFPQSNSFTRPVGEKNMKIVSNIRWDSFLLLPEN